MNVVIRNSGIAMANGIKASLNCGIHLHAEDIITYSCHSITINMKTLDKESLKVFIKHYSEHMVDCEDEDKVAMLSNTYLTCLPIKKPTNDY